MSRVNAGFACLFLAVLVAGRGAVAQIPADAPRVSGSVETSVLELDVVVTDKDGKPVIGLGPSDFEVRIGKKPVEITNFYERKPGPPLAAVPGGELTAGALPAPAEAVRPPRHVVLFVDRLQLLDKWKAEATFDALRLLLRRVVVAPGDDAMIVTWNRSVETVIPFTSDLAPIERALAREEALCRRPSETDAGLRQLGDEAAWFRALPKESVSGGVDVSRRAGAAGAYAQMRAKANALKAVFATLGGLPGRKIVVHASYRFSEIAGLEYMLAGQDPYGEGALDRAEFNAYGIVESVAAAANANGVTLYTLFPSGWPDDAQVLHADAPLSSYPKINSLVEGARGDMIAQNEVAALTPVATETGGTFAMGYQEASALASRVAADLESAYSLGVEAPVGNVGKALAVDVKTRDRSLNVRTRRTFFEKTPEGRVRDRVLANLFRPERDSRLTVTLAEAKTETKKGKTTVWLTLNVPVAQLARTPSKAGETGAFSVFVACTTAHGTFTDVIRQRQPFEVKGADHARAQAGHYTYVLPIVLASPQGLISVAVWDEVGLDAALLLVDVSEGKASVRR